LPRTIQDSFELLRKLNVLYIWIDSVCLLQNDVEDLDLGVAVMDRIYECSFFTVVAAEGHNANAGLPGVYPGSRVSRANFQIKPKVWLGVWTILDRRLEVTAYNSRGWT
jgi:hypothetical protein